MRFEYIPYGGSWMPLIPIVFRHGRKSLPSVGALVDTGATHTILPMEMAQILGLPINLTDQIETQIAGGGQCCVYPSPTKIEYILRDPVTSRECHWRGSVFFALGQQFVLLGHHQCLEHFDVTFHGRKRFLDITRS